MRLPPGFAQRIRGQIDVLVNKAKQPIGEAEYISLRNQYVSLVKDLMEHKDFSASVLVGFIDSLKSDFEAGRFDSLPELIATNMASDYLEQAEYLLQEGRSETNSHVSAAVLAGAVLENALRRIWQRQNPVIATTNGETKMLNELITDLKNANVFNELKAKQLHLWRDIRNAAAHGQFQQFSRHEVELMLKGVKQFLADYG